MQHTFITLTDLALLNGLFTKGQPDYNWFISMCENRNGQPAEKWISARCAPDRRKISVDYESIPDDVKESYALPPTYAEARQLLLAIKSNRPELEQTKKERLQVKAKLGIGAGKEIANRAGVSVQSVSGWFNQGTNSLRIEKVVKQMLAAKKRNSIAKLLEDSEQ